MLNKELLEILVCPVGKSELRLEGDALICTSCGAKYRIEDDIPIMLVDEAELPEGVSSPEELNCGQQETPPPAF
ncbi:MAG: Trm112 family protein [Bacteroidetes bacterium]|nr:Trm112 family protein [Bacteroidota bacterium]